MKQVHDVVDSIHADQAGRVQYHYTLVDVLAEWRSGEAVAQDDLAAVRWVKIADIDKYDLRTATRDVILMAQEKRNATGGGWPRKL